MMVSDGASLQRIFLLHPQRRVGQPDLASNPPCEPDEPVLSPLPTVRLVRYGYACQRSGALRQSAEFFELALDKNPRCFEALIGSVFTFLMLQDQQRDPETQIRVGLFLLDRQEGGWSISRYNRIAAILYLRRLEKAVFAAPIQLKESVARLHRLIGDQAMRKVHRLIGADRL